MQYYSTETTRCEASTVNGGQVGRWQLDSETTRSLHNLLARASRKKKMQQQVLCYQTWARS